MPHPTPKGICGRCAEPLIDPSRGCVFCAGERREKAIKVLVAAAHSDSNASLAARAEAVHTLRSIGHSSAQAKAARNEAKEGRSAEEIVKTLTADEQLEVA